MTDSADDLEALFEEMASQRQETLSAAPDTTSTESTAAPQTEEDPAGKLDLSGTSDDANLPIFDRLGNVVRMLHDSMRALGYDRSLSDVAIQVADAQDRLEYVATLTEQAANKVLNTLDEGMPEQDTLSKKSKEMEIRWNDLFAGKLSLEEFKVLAGDSKAFAAAVSEATEAEKARLLEIMMAQDFQDITGQLIKKVVNITKTVESELAMLLRDNAPPALREKIAQKEVTLMSGPSTPTVALSQDSVDDLLADLGF